MDSQNFTGKKSSKTTQLQICFYLKKKIQKNDSESEVLGPEIGATNYSGLCPDLETLCSLPC